MRFGIGFGSHIPSRKRGIDIAALFAGYPGRVGCYYGTKSGPSYTDILARNREALGPERVVNGDFSAGLTGWQLSVAPTLGTVSGGYLSIQRSADSAVNTGVSQAPGTAAIGKTYLVEFDVLSGVGNILINEVSTISVAASGRKALVITNTRDRAFEARAVVSSSATLDNVSVREIVDWQKLVLFDDPAGTVPVFSVFQSSRGRGLLLDSSQGLVRGPELITVRTPSGAVSGAPGTLPTGWTGAPTFNGISRSVVSVGANYIDFRLQGTATSTFFDFVSAFRSTNPAVSANEWYEADFSAMQVVSGALPTGGALTYNTVFLNGSTYVSQTSTNAPRHLAQVPSAGVTHMRHAAVLTFSNGAVVDITIRVFVPSVKPLPGNHMVQPTAAARGELSARYNLYDGSEGVNGLAPNGASTSLGYLQESTANSSHYALVNNATIPAGASVVTVYRAKTRGRNLRLACTSTAAWVGGSPVATFDLTAGTVVALGGATATIAPVAGQPGVYDCTMVATMGSASTAAHVYPIMTDAAGNTTYAGDGVSGVEFVRRDSRLSADVIPSIPAYQRVTSATDYDEVGFPVYLRGQTDDWAKTRINPNGATKALVMWAGQKMSDAAEAMLLESSVSSSNNPGTFALWQTPPVGMGQQMRWRSRGSGNADVLGGPAAPARVVARGVGSISDDSCAFTVNGVVTSSFVDQGTGTYIEQDVFFGARAGTSLFANIREFAPPLILFQPAADPGLSASQITALDKAYAKAVGVTL